MSDHPFELLFREMFEAVRATPSRNLDPSALHELGACRRLYGWVKANLPDGPNEDRCRRMQALSAIVDEAAYGERHIGELLQAAREEIFDPSILVESWTELFGLGFPDERVELASGLTIEWLGVDRHAVLMSRVGFGAPSTDLHILPLSRGGPEPECGWIVCERWEAPRPYDSVEGGTRWDSAVRRAERVFCLASLLFQGGWRSGASFHVVRGRNFSPTMRSRPPWGSGDPQRNLSREDVSLLQASLEMVEADPSGFAPALHWYEAGLFQGHRPWLRFVSWAMALEALALRGAQGAGIGRRFSTALAQHGVTEEDARWIWETRSNIVHGRSITSPGVLESEAVRVRNLLSAILIQYTREM